jgi:carbon monoxide dehydrogenase subunit G
MRYVYTLEITAPVEKVFDLIQDPQKHKLWLQGVEETRYVGDYDPERPVGARFVQKIREGRRVKDYDGEVTAFERPRHLGIRLYGKQFSVQVDYRLAPQGRGTHLDYAADITCGHWIIRVMGFLFGWLCRGILARQMKALKALAEGGD